MKYLSLLTLLVFFQFSSGQTKKQTGYTTLIDCLRLSFPDKGVAFDNTFNTFEAEFLKLNKMKDNSGKSYRALLESIVKNEGTGYKMPSPNISERIEKLEQPNEEILMNCMEGTIDDMPENVEAVLNFSGSNYSLDSKSYLNKLATTILDNFTVEQMGLRFYQMTIMDALEQVPE